MACLDGATGGWVLRTGVDCRILSPQSLQRRNFEALSSPPAGGAVGRGADGMTPECHPWEWCRIGLVIIWFMIQVSYLARDTEFPVRWITVVAAEARADAVPMTPVSSTIESSASTDNESNSIEPSDPWRPPGDLEARPEPEWVTSGEGFPLSLSALSRDVVRLVGFGVTGVVGVIAGGVVTAITVPRGVWPREGGAWLMLCRWGPSLVTRGSLWFQNISNWPCKRRGGRRGSGDRMVGSLYTRRLRLLTSCRPQCVGLRRCPSTVFTNARLTRETKVGIIFLLHECNRNWPGSRGLRPLRESWEECTCRESAPPFLQRFLATSPMTPGSF